MHPYLLVESQSASPFDLTHIQVSNCNIQKCDQWPLNLAEDNTYVRGVIVGIDNKTITILPFSNREILIDVPCSSLTGL